MFDIGIKESSIEASRMTHIIPDIRRFFFIFDKLFKNSIF